MWSDEDNVWMYAGYRRKRLADCGICRPFQALVASRTRSGFGGAPTILVVAFAETKVLLTLGAAAIRRGGALRGVFGNGLCLRRVFNRPRILREFDSLMRLSRGGMA